MKDTNITKLETGYVPDPQLIKSKELQEIQAQLTFLADEILFLSKAINALTTHLKSARNNK